MHFGKSTRREFIALVGGAGAAWPLAARGQTKMPVIGVLATRGPADEPDLLAAFHQGLKDTGYVEGQNTAIEYRFAEGQYERLAALAADLVRRQVTVIAALGTPAAPAAKVATETIPIVFTVGVDPVEAGLVTSLNRPGGNITGVTGLGVELSPKRLELLHELLPSATVVAALMNPATTAAGTQSKDLQASARGLGLHLHLLGASTESDFEASFAKLVQLRAGGLVVSNDPFFVSRSDQLAALALRHAVPTIFEFRAFVAAGGLMSYGSNLTDLYRLAGVYTGRVLKGEKPADLPVQQSTKVELILNLKTAKALGITFPLTLLGRADEVIE
jgi:putative tryptophan/tyrosine transport system substrate-binding protein